ncbi:MAG: acyl-CoA dehydrogenase family protein [Polyangia bacterium]
MTTTEQQIIQETMRAFRKKRIEPEWERLNTLDAQRYTALFAALQEAGATSIALPEEEGGLALGPQAKFDLLSELGAGAPALAFGLLSHLSAVALLREAAGDQLPRALQSAFADARFALVASPLDGRPETGFEVHANRPGFVSGRQRVAQPYADWLVVPVREGEKLHLGVLRAHGEGVTFVLRESSHGLRLIPFGELVLDGVALGRDRVFDWPASGRVANQADGLCAALLTGIVRELAERAMRYALDRYQGGKMIHEHDAVQQLVGPMQLAARALQALAVDTLGSDRFGDGSASAFAVELVRQCGLDAIQTFGGYGYMEDYRVERYTRDANTLETFWIHAAARQREIARNRFAEMATQETR